MNMPSVAVVGERRVALASFVTRWVESGDGSSGEVLLVHSIGLNATAYGGLRAALPTGWRVCAYDQRGHGAGKGETSFSLSHLVDDAVAALGRMRGAPVHLAGHSMGGVIAALAAARAPGRVASLALIAAPAAGMPAFSDRADAVEREGFAAAAQATLVRWFDGELDDAATREAQALARRMLQDVSPEGFAAMWRALASFTNFQALDGAIPLPLCIAAAGDASTPPEAMRRITDDLPRAQRGRAARLEIVQGAGHMVPLTRPAPVAALLACHWALSSRQHPGPAHDHKETT